MRYIDSPSDLSDSSLERTYYHGYIAALCRRAPAAHAAAELLVHRWSGKQALVKVADALRLSAAETTHLLQIAGYPSLETLLAQAEGAHDRALLASWTTPGMLIPSMPKIARRARLPVSPDSFVGRE